jgi:hypothetical protein
VVQPASLVLGDHQCCGDSIPATHEAAARNFVGYG